MHALPRALLAAIRVDCHARKGGLQEVRDGVKVFLTNKHLMALKRQEKKRRKREYLPSTCPLKFKSRFKKSRPGEKE